MICLLEMPGFESDGQKVDEDILDQLRLALPVSQEVKGILYLHDISDAKLTGPSAKVSTTELTTMHALPRNKTVI